MLNKIKTENSNIPRVTHIKGQEMRCSSLLSHQSAEEGESRKRYGTGTQEDKRILEEELNSYGGGSKDRNSPGVAGWTRALDLTHFVRDDGSVLARPGKIPGFTLTRRKNQDQDSSSSSTSSPTLKSSSHHLLENCKYKICK